MAATSSGEVGFSAVRIRESGVTLADENWLNDVDANITTAITGYLDAISSLPLGAEIRLDDVKHEQYLKKFQKLKTTLQLRALRCEDEGNNFLLSMVLDRLGKMTSRHKEMKHKIPHFSYAVSTKDAELQARAVIDGYQAKYQALINDPEALPYRLLTSYTKLKSAYLTLMHSISSEDPYRKVVENTFAGIRAVHRTLPFIKEMKLKKLIPDALCYGMLVKFCKNNKIKGYVPRTFKDLKAQIAEISSYVLSHVEAVECDFIYSASSEEMEKKWEIIKLLPESKELKFSVYEGSASKRFIQSQSNSKLCEEDLTFVDGDLKGRRVYLDGREESGIFDPKWGCLIRGYRTNVAKEIELVDPVEVFRWDLDRNQSMRVFEFLDELCLMERYFVQGHARFRSAEGNLLDFLLNASMRTSGNFSIKKVLGHSSFSSLKNEFISRALGSDGFGAVRLLDFSNQALSDVLDEIDLSTTNPLRIVKEKSSSNLITRVAYFATSENGGREIMDKLNALFPEEFKALGPNLLVTVLRASIINGYDLVFLRDCIERYEASGGVLSPFHRAWVETAFGQVPHCDVALFSPDEQAFLEETAYAVGNCHIHIPPLIKVTPDQYTVNFLCLEEELEDPLSLDRIASWMRANPGAITHVWYDGAFLSADLVRNADHEMLEKLEPVAYEKLIFRDVRQFGILEEAEKLFPKTTPLASRLQLMRALVADQVMDYSPSKYYVSTTLDRPPLSSDELFDRKTVSLLNMWGFVIPGRKGAYDKRDMSFQIWKKKKEFLKSNFEVFINGNVRRWRRGLEETEQTHEYLFQAMVAQMCFKLSMYYGCELPYSNQIITKCEGSEEEKRAFFENVSVRKKIKYILLGNLPSISQTSVIRRHLSKISLGELLKNEVPKKPLPPLISSSTASCSSSL